MRLVYVDTSVFVSLFFEDSRLDKNQRKLLESADEIMSSALLEAEFLSVIKREGANPEKGRAYLGQVSLVYPERSLASEIEQTLRLGYSRGADLFHLACALYVDPETSHLLFLSSDIKQTELASKLGFQILKN